MKIRNSARKPAQQTRVPCKRHVRKLPKLTASNVSHAIGFLARLDSRGLL
jgi:hypothetical protein